MLRYMVLAYITFHPESALYNYVTLHGFGIRYIPSRKCAVSLCYITWFWHPLHSIQKVRCITMLRYMVLAYITFHPESALYNYVTLHGFGIRYIPSRKCAVSLCYITWFWHPLHSIQKVRCITMLRYMVLAYITFHPESVLYNYVTLHGFGIRYIPSRKCAV